MTKIVVMEGDARLRNLGMQNADIVCGVLEREPHSCQQEPGAESSPQVHIDVKEHGGPRAESCN